MIPMAMVLLWRVLMPMAMVLLWRVTRVRPTHGDMMPVVRDLRVFVILTAPTIEGQA